MKRNLPIIFLSLLSAGSLGAAGYFWSHQQELAAENASLRARQVTSYLAKPAGASRPASMSAKPEAAEAMATGPGGRPPTGTPEEQAKRKEFESRMTAQRQKESDTRQLARLTLLKTRLQLTPEQEQMAAAALQKSRDLRKAARDGFQPGQPPDFAKMQQMMKSDSIAAAEIRAQLTPEQQTEYDNIRLEERADRTEQQTNRQVGEWQQYLQMTPEQKDAVFQVLSEQSMANDPEVQPDAKDFDEMKQRTEASQAAQREALAGVLDETQMTTYDELNKSRSELFGGFGGPGGPGGFGGGGGPPPPR